MNSCTYLSILAIAPTLAQANLANAWEQPITTLLTKLPHTRHLTSTHSAVRRYLGLEKAFSIDDARQAMAELSFATASLRVLCLGDMATATPQSQHALLKSIEEPPPLTQLVLFASSVLPVLPTLRSRCLTIFLEKSVEKPTIPPLLPEILNQSYGGRIALAEKYKERGEALALLDQLLAEVIHQIEQNGEATLPRIAAARSLIQAQQDIRHNINTRLALENCLFSLH